MTSDKQRIRECIRIIQNTLKRIHEREAQKNDISKMTTNTTHPTVRHIVKDTD